MTGRFSWHGAIWLRDRLSTAGFEIPELVTEAFVSEVIRRGLLESREQYDRFWTEAADQVVRNGFGYVSADSPAHYRSSYIDALAAGRDQGALVKEHPGLFTWPADEPSAPARAFLLEQIAARKAVELENGDYRELTAALERGPAAAFKKLAASMPLAFVKAKSLGLPMDGPCLISAEPALIRPILLFEPGRSWRALQDLSVSVGVLIDGVGPRCFDDSLLVQGMRWYQRVTSDEQAALGLAAYARFVVELAASINENPTTGETTP